MLLITFARQYPGWLFPATSDIDPDAPSFDSPPPKCIIDSLNPRTWVRAIQTIIDFSPDFLLIP